MRTCLVSSGKREWPSKFGTHKTVKARIWPWPEPFFWEKSLKRYKVFPLRSGAGVQFSISEQLLHKNVQRFLGGLVFKAHRLLHHLTLGLRVIKKKKKKRECLERRLRLGQLRAQVRLL